MIVSPSELGDLAEIVRIPSPAPMPQSLAHDGEHLWLGSWQTARVYGIFPTQGRVFEEMEAPGKPVGCTVLGDELRFVCSENGEDDNRFIRRYIKGHGFKSRERIACPDDTGSFLAYDGERLWLSQRYNKRIVEITFSGRVLRSVDIGEEILGIAWVGERLYLSTWLGKDRGGCRIAYVDARSANPQPAFVAASPFVAVSLARDGDRLWTNDSKANEIVAFTIPS